MILLSCKLIIINNMKRKTLKQSKTTKKQSKRPSILRIFEKSRWLAILIIALIGTAMLVKSFASDGQIYLTPSTASLQKGSNIALSVRINPSTPVDIVEDVIISFDSTKLQFISIDSSGSAFESSLYENIAAGQIKLSRATFGASISTDSLITKINFQALAGSKTTTIRVSGNAASQTTGGYTNPSGGESVISFTQLRGGGKKQ